MGARRVRACILSIIPGDIVDAALAQCSATLRDGIQGNLEDERRKIADWFADHHALTVDHLAEFLGYPLSQASADDIVTLRGVATSLKDGARRGEFFPSLAKASTVSDANDDFGGS